MQLICDKCVKAATWRILSRSSEFSSGRGMAHNAFACIDHRDEVLQQMQDANVQTAQFCRLRPDLAPLGAPEAIAL